MKKSLILIALLMVLCFCTSSYAANAAGQQWYVGIGGSYALENFDGGDVEDFLDYVGVDVDFDDGWGANLSVGYHVNDNCSLAFVYSYLSGFDSDESATFEEVMAAVGVTEDDLMDFGVSSEDLAVLHMADISLGAQIDVDVMTFMLEGKYAMSGNVSPYLVLGLGLMYADADGDLRVGAAGQSFSFGGEDDSDTEICWKVGLGVDWWVTPNVTVGLEGSYVAAFSDLEFDLLDIPDVGAAEMGIEYFNIGLGVAYHF